MVEEVRGFDRRRNSYPGSSRIRTLVYPPGLLLLSSPPTCQIQDGIANNSGTLPVTPCSQRVTFIHYSRLAKTLAYVADCSPVGPDHDLLHHAVDDATISFLALSWSRSWICAKKVFSEKKYIKKKREEIIKSI